MRRTCVQRLRDQSGQMTIFIALIFQVLFIFFAMVINIGLLVHDKINLQNAVDFGAYYAAQRQAETLNEIAHINYQLRQDYKLLAWRYHVLGTLGRKATTDIGNPADPNTCLPPARTQGFPLSDSLYRQCDPRGTGARIREFPSVCVAHELWSEFVTNSRENENYCFRPYLQDVPSIPPVQIIAPFIPGIGQTAASAAQAEQTRLAALSRSAPINWAFTMQMIYSYKLSIASRKEMIKKLKANLVAANPVDQQMMPVRDGVLKTVQKNLTASNLESFDPSYFQVLNGLADGDCASGGTGNGTIVEVSTVPRLYYTNNNPGSAAAFQTVHDQPPADGAIDAFDPNGLMRSLASEPGSTESSYHSTLGFEKNPWCMAYVAVRAKTKPRKPFLPFGQPVEMEARAFAQPFGGRIGPWYQAGWSRGAPNSNQGNRVDPLTSVRRLGAPAAVDPFYSLPNYSRYPGDELGLFSAQALGAQRHKIFQYVYRPNFTRGLLRLAYYFSFASIPQTGDPLAWNSTDPDQTRTSPEVEALRQAETAAVAPDLFDITYYSIDPSYTSYYLGLGTTVNRFQGMPQLFGFDIKPMPDIGARNGTSIAAYDVMGQIGLTVDGQGNDPGLMASGLSWVVRKWEHLLTAWAPTKAQTFTFPDNRFGVCTNVSKPSLLIPGRCSAGGRVGYSVRLISREHLISDQWKIGGEGVGPGGIINKPSLAF